MRDLFREPSRDRALGEALRRLEAVAEPGDAQTLRERIMAAAQPRLAGLAMAAPRWWEMISAWRQVAVPVGLAASLAAGLLVQGIAIETNGGSSTGELGADSTLVIAAFSEPASAGVLTAHLIAPEGNDWLLEQAVSQ